MIAWGYINCHPCVRLCFSGVRSDLAFRGRINAQSGILCLVPAEDFKQAAGIQWIYQEVGEHSHGQRYIEELHQDCKKVVELQ